jgi:hypothetical protein
MILTNKAILVIGTEPWCGPLLSKHHIVIELCKRNQVMYVEPAFHAGSLLRGRWPRLDYPEFYHNIQPNSLKRLRPWRLPKSESVRLAGKMSEYLVEAQIRGRGFKPDLILSFHPTYVFLAGYWRAPFVFYSVDTQLDAAAEARALAGSDLVVAATDVLYQRYIGRARKLKYLPHGIDVDALIDQAKQVPADMVALPRPIAGFVGSVNLHLDIPLIEQVAHARPSASLVLIGPYSRGSYGDGMPDELLVRLRRLPNVHLMGPKPSEQLGAYINACDIGIVPYDLNHPRVHFSLHKTLQYMALGKAVVTTCALPKDTSVPGVYVGANAETFVAAMDRSLAEQSVSTAVEYRAFAQQHTWNRRVSQLEEWLV